MGADNSHPQSPAGIRRLRRLRDYAEHLEKMIRSNTPEGRMQGKVSALRWAIRMLEEKYPTLDPWRGEVFKNEKDPHA